MDTRKIHGICLRIARFNQQSIAINEGRWISRVKDFTRLDTENIRQIAHRLFDVIMDRQDKSFEDQIWYKYMDSIRAVCPTLHIGSKGQDKIQTELMFAGCVII